MKTKTKRQWTQLVAVAAAAVCAVTATCAGVTINHADAADETTTSYGEAYIAFAGAAQSNGATLQYWGEGDSSNSGCTVTPVEIVGNGTYTTSIAIDSTVNSLYFLAVVSSITDEACGITPTEVLIDGVAADYTCTSGTFTENGRRVHLGGSWSQSTDFALDGVISESITITFNITGLATDAPVAETTTTTEATTTTTTTTTASSEEAADTTTTTTTTETSESSAATTTTTVPVSTTTTTTEETTTTTEATTTTTTTKATTTTAPNYDKVITAFTKQSEKGEDGKVYPFIEVEHNNAKSITLVYKILTDDTNTSGAIGTGGANWTQEPWNELTVPTDKLVVINYVVPSTATDTLKISVYWPGVSGVEFQSVTLHYDSDPDVTTTEYDSGLTFETITVQKSNKIDMLDKCCLVATVKGPSNYNIGGGVYYDDVKIEWSDEHTDSATNLLTKVFEIRNQSNCDFQIHWYSDGAATEATAPVNLVTYYEGDASLNGKVNGSDVLAIIKYITAAEKNDVQDVVCDHDDNGKVAMADAISLTKAILADK